jgi:hypothetical protein
MTFAIAGSYRVGWSSGGGRRIYRLTG